jgi:transposase
MGNDVPYQSQSEKAEQLRHTAVNLYLGGQKVSTIARQTGRSRQWVHTTLNRYRAEGRDGLVNRSRTPHQVHNRTSPETESAVVRIRETILSGADPILRYASVGARIIRSELKRMGVTAPSPRTINRILQRHGMQQSRHGQEKRKLPKDYPWPQADEANALHLFDFVTRVTKGGSRFYGYHLLDQRRRWPYLEAHSCKAKPKKQLSGLSEGQRVDEDKPFFETFQALETFLQSLHLFLREFDASLIDLGNECHNRLHIFE